MLFVAPFQLGTCCDSMIKTSWAIRNYLEAEDILQGYWHFNSLH